MPKMPLPLYDPARPGLPHRSVVRDRLPARESARAWMSDRWESWPDLSADALRIVGDYRPRYLGQEAPSVVLAERVRPQSPAPRTRGRIMSIHSDMSRAQLRAAQKRNREQANARLEVNVRYMSHVRREPSLPPRGSYQATVLAWIRTRIAPVEVNAAPGSLTAAGHFRGACKHLITRGQLKARVLWVRGVRGRASEYWPAERPWPPLPDGTLSVRYNPPECAP